MTLQVWLRWCRWMRRVSQERITMRAALSWDGKGKRIAALALVLAMLSPTAVMAAPKTSATDTISEVYSSLSRGSSWS